MKIVKNLLRSSVAGLMAVAGAQAADLPLKAKPVEYVKVCSLYGAGFWYVPGTDTCLKIGSLVRVDTGWNESGTSTTGVAAGGGQFTRTDTSQFAMRTRALISVDLRTQTEYGVLRSYFEGGFQATGATGGAPANDVVYFDAGFIQFAGLTAGRIRSYFDINSPYEFSYMTPLTTGDSNTFNGLWGIAYTAQFGNGFSATLSFEDGGSTSQGNNAGQSASRGRRLSNMSVPTEWGLGTLNVDNEGWRFPDVVGDVRVDQSWGYAQISMALHDVAGGYYTSAAGDACGANAFCQTLGHPGDDIGWAVSGGFHLNDLFGLKGDTLGAQAVYSVGASGYAVNGLGGSQVYGATSAGFGWLTDGVFSSAGGGTSIELTTVWSVHVGAQHLWSPKWRTSLYGGFTEIDYSGTAATIICTSGGLALGAPSNCSPSWSLWQVGSRTQWNPHPDLNIGVDVMWTHLNTAFAGTATLAANGARPAGVYAIEDQGVASVIFRIQRNFLP